MHRLELHPFLICSVEYADLRGEKCVVNHSLSLKARELTELMEETDQFGRRWIFYEASSENKPEL